MKQVKNGVTRMKMTVGKINTFAELFESQKLFQQEVMSRRDQSVDLPRDDVAWFNYHITAMTEELGELLKADKRWKTHRNAAYDRNNKVEELADVFITAINIAMFSGIADEEMFKAIVDKINENGIKLTGSQIGEGPY